MRASHRRNSIEIPISIVPEGTAPEATVRGMLVSPGNRGKDEMMSMSHAATWEFPKHVTPASHHDRFELTSPINSKSQNPESYTTCLKHCDNETLNRPGCLQP